ncbi:MAG: CoB--CoM heterodisulfide reductase subunit B [Candidatus Lokiarchaeota archaeon]|nr:CoB--CoM heterodisulfide reductase subunit B [Candidatus Lokiarchaeota archaeon]MBD3201758.1 CoB--CoM heterodisulfide reductase subunit B [Candidatus Lokiarchaeota archaeon]
MAKVDEFKLFQGCTIGNRIPFIEASARRVFDKLGIETSEAPFACCPDPVGFNAVDHESWLAMGARNLTLAEEEEKDIVSLCNGCFQTLKAVNEELKHDEHEKGKVNEILDTVGRNFKGSINVKHFLEVIHEIGEEKIKENIVNELSGLKVACHTGCHYNRPSEIMQTDDPMEPKKLREVVKLTGAVPVDYEEEMLCCGSGVANAEEEPAMQVLKNKFDSAINAGAEAFVVICPACFQQMDTNQRNLSKMYEEDYKIPILYLTELLALSFGISHDDIGMKYHRARANSLLEKLNLK